MQNVLIDNETDNSESAHEKELAEYQELIYKLGYAPRPDDE